MALMFEGAQRVDDQLRERASAATDIEPLKSLWQRQPVEENLSGGTAPAPHQPFVGLTVGKKPHAFDHILPATLNPSQSSLHSRISRRDDIEVAPWLYTVPQEGAASP